MLIHIITAVFPASLIMIWGTAEDRLRVSSWSSPIQHRSEKGGVVFWSPVSGNRRVPVIQLSSCCYIHDLIKGCLISGRKSRSFDTGPSYDSSYRRVPTSGCRNADGCNDWCYCPLLFHRRLRAVSAGGAIFNRIASGVAVKPGNTSFQKYSDQTHQGFALSREPKNKRIRPMFFQKKGKFNLYLRPFSQIPNWNERRYGPVAQLDRATAF